MGRLLRTVLKVLASLVLLVVVLAVALVFIVDPNQYKPAIEDAVLDNTGLQLNIAGDLSLTFRPYIGVTLNDVRLRNPSRPQELASSTQISLRVAPLSLARGPLVVQELSADDFHINWYVDEAGVSIWDTGQQSDPASGLTTEPAAVTTADEESGLSANINLISIANASIDIQNLQQDFFYTIRGLDITSRDSNVENRPFPLQASFELVDHSGPKPLPFTLSSTNLINLDAGDFAIQDIQLSLTPLLLEGNIEITDLSGAMNMRGHFESNTFALDDLLAHLAEDEQATGNLALPGLSEQLSQQVSFNSDFNGDSNGIEIPTLQIDLGDTRIETEATLRFANELSPTNLSFEVISNALDLTPYLADEQTDEADSADSALPTATVALPRDQQDDDIEIPRSAMSGINVQGTISIESLIYADMRFDDINVFTILENGVLDIETPPTGFLGGTVQGNARVNSRPQQSELTLQFSTSEINVADLALPLFELGAVTGKLNLEANYTSQGNTLNQWRDNLDGSSSFAVADNLVDIGVIKQVFAAITALSPTGESIEQWPDVVQFNDFSGYVIFKMASDKTRSSR